MTGSEIYERIRSELYFGQNRGDKYNTKDIVLSMNRAQEAVVNEIFIRYNKTHLVDEWMHKLYETCELSLDKKHNKDGVVFKAPKDIVGVQTLSGDIKKGKCLKTRVGFSPMPNENIVASINSSYWESSFDFEDVFYNRVKNGFKFEARDFTIEKVNAVYLRRPKIIMAGSIESYIYADGKKHTKDSSCELNGYAIEMIVKGSVLLLRDNQSDLSLSLRSFINKYLEK